MVKYYKRKVVRRARRGRMYKKKRRPRSKTGFLSVVQKEYFSYTIPAGPLANGHIEQLSFNISSLPNFPEFDRLFDQYRIVGVAGQLTPQTNTNDTINPGQTYIQSIDLDGGPITTYDQILACANAKQSPWCSAGGMVPTKKWYVKPRFKNNILADPGGGGVPPTYAQTLGRYGAWVDIADGGQTEHYGMNFGWRTASPVGLNIAQVVNCNLTFYLQFRKVR